MALIVDYATLQAAIGIYGKRADITANVDMLIQLAEAEIYADSTLGGSEIVTSALVTSPGSDLIALPSTYQGARSLVMTSPSYQMKFRTPNQLYANWAAGAEGAPQEYTVLGRGGPLGQFQLQVRPTPTVAWVLRMVYNSQLAALSSVSSNWLLSAYPNLFLFGALRQAAAFAIEDERIQVWDSAYKQLLLKIARRQEEQLYPNGLQMVIMDESAQNEDGMSTGNANVTTMLVSGALAAGDLVNIFDSGGGVPNCRLANAAAGTSRPAHGWVSAAFTAGQTASVFFDGFNVYRSGMTVGQAWLSDTVPGGVMFVAPVGATKTLQQVGTVIAPTSIEMEFNSWSIL